MVGVKAQWLEMLWLNGWSYGSVVRDVVAQWLKLGSVVGDVKAQWLELRLSG